MNNQIIQEYAFAPFLNKDDCLNQSFDSQPLCLHIPKELPGNKAICLDSINKNIPKF